MCMYIHYEHIHYEHNQELKDHTESHKWHLTNTTHANFHLPDIEAKCTPFGRTNIVEVVDGFDPPPKRESNVVSPCFLQGSGNAVKYQIWMMHLYVHFFSLPPCFETCSFSLLYPHSLSRSLEDGGTEKTGKN